MDFEARLNEALDAGDIDAAATLVIQSLGPQILAYLRSVMRAPDEAEDVFAVFAENVWKGLPSWRRQSSIRTWAYRVAWNAATHLLRDPYRRRRDRFPTTMASRVAQAVVSSGRGTRERQASALDEIRATLAPEEQSLLTLRLDRDLSWREVSEIMAEPGTPATDPATLRKRYERVRPTVARLARERGLLRD
jgi:RNA polymerase sigma-70 factor (ECF subfamily)